jgi:hypothetical protein
MSATCENCGQPRAEDDLFCGFCGRRTDAMPVLNEAGPQTGTGTGTGTGPTSATSEEPRTIQVPIFQVDAPQPDNRPLTVQVPGLPPAPAQAAAPEAVPAQPDAVSSGTFKIPSFQPAGPEAAVQDDTMSEAAVHDDTVLDDTVPDEGDTAPEAGEPRTFVFEAARPPAAEPQTLVLQAAVPQPAEPEDAGPQDNVPRGIESRGIESPDAGPVDVPEAVGPAQHLPSQPSPSQSGSSQDEASQSAPAQAGPSQAPSPQSPTLQPSFTQLPAPQPVPQQSVPQLFPQQVVPQPASAGAPWRNPTYLGMRLLFEQVPESSFDPITNLRYLFRLWRQGAIFGAIYLIGAFLSGIPVLVLSLAGLGILAILWYIVGVVLAIALFIVYLIVPVPALLSEWKFLIDDKGAAWQATLVHAQGALQRRQVPLDAAEVRMISLAAGESREYLELRRGIFAGYVASFPQGADLYVGWTFWLKLSPGRWLVMLVARSFQELTQRGSDMHVTLRYDSAKAMRDSMHAAVHEGVYAATGVAL